MTRSEDHVPNGHLPVTTLSAPTPAAPALRTVCIALAALVRLSERIFDHAWPHGCCLAAVLGILV